MLPYGSVAENILWRKKVEAYIFPIHLVPNIVPGTCTCLLPTAPTIAPFNYACSKLFELQVLGDTYRTFHGFVLPFVNEVSTW
jgi:hypothetical protein